MKNRSPQTVPAEPPSICTIPHPFSVTDGDVETKDTPPQHQVYRWIQHSTCHPHPKKASKLALSCSLLEPSHGGGVKSP